MRIVLKRAMMPSVLSFATEMAVVVAAPASGEQGYARGQEVDVGTAPPAGS